jgi:hypothetical protein
MNHRRCAACAGFWIVLSTALASAQAPSVKDPTLAEVRLRLTRYDLSPPGTLALLAPLAAIARATLGSPEATEAGFLHAAVASDMLFIAEFTGDHALRLRLAEQLSVAPESLQAQIQRELEACRSGVYREPAELALAGLNPQPSAAGAPASDGRVARPASAIPDVRRDARLVREAAEYVRTDRAFGARFAAAGVDPCTGAAKCAAPHASLAPAGRRALSFMRELSAAATRLGRASFEDPLAEALRPALEQPLATLRAASLRLPPALPSDQQLRLPSGADLWPAPDLLVWVHAAEIRYAHLPRARIGADGEPVFLPEAGAIYPDSRALPAPADAQPPTRGISELVSALKSELAAAASAAGSAGTPLAPPSAALLADADVPAQQVARALVSLRSAGVGLTLLAARTSDGALLGVPLRVVLPSVDGPLAQSDLKLRVRLGGYSLDVGRGVVDIPRVRDESGLRFDLPSLRSAVATRAPRSAAVSFMTDVPTEQVLLALFYVTPSREPVDLVIQ